MIISIKELIGLIMLGFADYNPEFVESSLKNWADSIVDECAGNFECTIKVDSLNIEYPVLVRASVLAVKNKIQ